MYLDQPLLAGTSWDARTAHLPYCREGGALLTQVPLSPGGFAFPTQLPDSCAPFATQAPQLDAAEMEAAGAAVVVQQALERQLPLPPQQQQVPAGHQPQASEQHSLQGSVGQAGSVDGDGADSHRSRRLSGSWLLTPLGALAGAFKRTASQVGLDAA